MRVGFALEVAGQQWASREQSRNCSPGCSCSLLGLKAAGLAMGPVEMSLNWLGNGPTIGSRLGSLKARRCKIKNKYNKQLRNNNKKKR